ncbi:oxalurate catabolism protein HpxZ [Algiphilus sp. W345]|uniref:Oxalurate catabolism protein HpxZ n=1 Tax=Banduia mediterranea TaxID=3075609 RepID=A0ABU2WHF0_9GAMM|nr:oxalurate catabolism protein HpxZ [Algiphilus sp. W345]MDT0497303.1 oxalurate catabolism protein HpxZ [Algiphilus sp. W345]
MNDPATLAELEQVFERYEAALLANDVVALNDFFWCDEQVLRYGITEHSHGHAALSAYRLGATPVDRRRRLLRTVITTFGCDAGAASTEFSTPTPAVIGRQTQTWIRFAQGWRIVAAHVSLIDAAHVAPPGERP